MKQPEPRTWPGRGRPDPKKVLWENLCSLMRYEAAKGNAGALNRDGEPNLNWLARETGIGPATASRIKEQQTGLGLDTLDKIAARWGLKAGDLLLPGLDPANPPVASISEKERANIERLKRLKQAIDGVERRIFDHGPPAGTPERRIERK